EEIPRSCGAIAGHFDDRVDHHVLRKTDRLLETDEQLADGGVSFRVPDAAAFPLAILGEDRGDAVRIVVVVADRAVGCFQLFDRLDALETIDAFCQVLQVHFESPLRRRPPTRETITLSTPARRRYD